MVFMCSDGVGRTGAFISTHAEMERMKAETVVDLFQFIKGIRTQRVGMMSNKVGKAIARELIASATISISGSV